MTEISPWVSCVEPKQEHGPEAELLLAVPPLAQPWHSPGTALAWSRSPQQPRGFGRATRQGRGRGGQQRDTSSSGTIGWSPGWRLDGAYVLGGMEPAGRSQHRAAEVTGSQKALLQRAETEAVGSHASRSTNRVVSASPAIWVSFRAEVSQDQAVQGALRHADEVPAASSARLSTCQSSREGKQSSLALSRSLGTAGGERVPSPSPSLPAPSRIAPMVPGRHRSAPLCARFSPLLRRKGGLRIRTSLQELRAGRPAPRQRSLLRSSYLLGSRRAIFRACLNDPEYLQWAVGSQPKRLHPPDPGGWR